MICLAAVFDFLLGREKPEKASEDEVDARDQRRKKARRQGKDEVEDISAGI